MEYALRFEFQASNNEAEYEAVISGRNLAHSMEADQLEVCNNSQLVVKHIEDDYEAKGEKMIRYLKKVRKLLKKFVQVQVRHIPRMENTRAHALAKLATASQEDLDRQVMSAKLIYVLSSFHMLFCAFYIHIHVKLIKFPLNLVL